MNRGAVMFFLQEQNTKIRCSNCRKEADKGDRRAGFLFAMRQNGAWKCVVRASGHKRGEENRGSQAVDALQTEPIVCRWASNGPTAGHKERSSALACRPLRSSLAHHHGRSAALLCQMQIPHFSLPLLVPPQQNLH